MRTRRGGRRIDRARGEPAMWTAAHAVWASAVARSGAIAGVAVALMGRRCWGGAHVGAACREDVGGGGEGEGGAEAEERIDRVHETLLGQRLQRGGGQEWEKTSSWTPRSRRDRAEIAPPCAE